MKKITLIVKDMHCVNCTMTLQALEDDLEGVSSVEASYTKQCMTIEFDETKVDLERIMGAVHALGYTPEIG